MRSRHAPGASAWLAFNQGDDDTTATADIAGRLADAFKNRLRLQELWGLLAVGFMDRCWAYNAKQAAKIGNLGYLVGSRATL